VSKLPPKAREWLDFLCESDSCDDPDEEVDWCIPGFGLRGGINWTLQHLTDAGFTETPETEEEQDQEFQAVCGATTRREFVELLYKFHHGDAEVPPEEPKTAVERLEAKLKEMRERGCEGVGFTLPPGAQNQSLETLAEGMLAHLEKMENGTPVDLENYVL